MGWVGLVWGSGLLPVRKTVAGDGGLVTGTRKKTDEGPAPVWEAGEAGEALLPVGDRNVPLLSESTSAFLPLLLREPHTPASVV